METKKIRSRSNKNPGDLIEEKWRIVSKTVIAEPFTGDPRHGIAPRQGIYDYDCVPADGGRIEVAVPDAPTGAGHTKAPPIMTFRRVNR